MEFSLLKAYLFYYVKQIVSVLWGKLGIALMFAALMPHLAALQVLGFLFVVDFTCGVLVAKKTKTLSSFGMRRGLAKLLVYVIFICCVAALENTILGFSVATEGAIGLLAGTELLSITENLVLLGLPIPYAAKILRLVSTKAQSMGIDVGDDPGAAAAVKDMIDLLQEDIPTFKDPTLRKCLDVYVTQWYLFMRDLSPGAMTGDTALVAERLGSQIDHVLCDIRANMTRDGIDQDSQRIFLNVWNRDLLARFVGQVKVCCLDKEATVDEKVDRIRDQLVLMAMRLVRKSQQLNSGTENTLTSHADMTVETDPTHH